MNANFTTDQLKQRMRSLFAKERAKYERGDRPDPYDDKTLMACLDVIDSRDATDFDGILADLNAKYNQSQREQRTIHDATVSINRSFVYSYMRWTHAKPRDGRAIQFESRMGHTSTQKFQLNDNSCLPTAIPMVPDSAEDCVEITTPDGRRLVWISPQLQKRLDRKPEVKAAFDKFLEPVENTYDPKPAATILSTQPDKVI